MIENGKVVFSCTAPQWRPVTLKEEPTSMPSYARPVLPPRRWLMHRVLGGRGARNATPRRRGLVATLDSVPPLQGGVGLGPPRCQGLGPRSIQDYHGVGRMPQALAQHPTLPSWVGRVRARHLPTNRGGGRVSASRQAGRNVAMLGMPSATSMTMTRTAATTPKM